MKFLPLIDVITIIRGSLASGHGCANSDSKESRFKLRVDGFMVMLNIVTANYHVTQFWVSHSFLESGRKQHYRSLHLAFLAGRYCRPKRNCNGNANTAY